MPCLLALIRKDGKTYAKEAIRHLVFNEYDDLQQNYANGVDELMEFYMDGGVNLQVYL